MMSMRLLAAAALAAMQPATDLARLAEAGRQPSFDQVAEARFDLSRPDRFETLRTWAKTTTDEDRARYFVRIGINPDGKPRWRERVRCSNADRKSLTRAMTVAAAMANDRSEADRIWSEVERNYADAVKLEAERTKAARADAASRPTPLGRELAMRVAVDQSWREAEFAHDHDPVTAEAIGWRFWSRMCHVDNDNTVFLQGVVGRGAWPTVSHDGREAANDAWLLAQHADDEPAFQRQVLTLMEPLVAKSEASGANYALLWDRVALAEKRPQRFATQFETTKQGCLAASTTEDHDGVDRRRTSMGLKPLHRYADELAELYHAKLCPTLFASDA